MIIDNAIIIFSAIIDNHYWYTHKVGTTLNQLASNNIKSTKMTNINKTHYSKRWLRILSNTISPLFFQ